MVRTAAAGIKVSSGKSGKKGGGSGGVRPSSSKGGSSSSSNRLPSIPHTETPSWQKPITNFFGNKPQLKNTESTNSNDFEKENYSDKNNMKCEIASNSKKEQTTENKVLVEDTKNEENNQSKSNEELIELNTIENEPLTKKHKIFI